MNVHRLLAIVGATISLAASGGGDHLGTWRYQGQDASLDVRLKENGECFVSAYRPREGYLQPNCRYRITNSEILIALPQQVAPAPIRLVPIANWEILRVEGEGKRYLRRVPPGEQ